MRCSDYEQFFTPYIDGKLAREEHEALRFHLSGCFRCRIKLDDMQRTVHAMRSIPRAVLRPEFNEALRQRIHTEITHDIYVVPFRTRARAAFREFGQKPFRAARLVFAASLCLIVSVALITRGSLSALFEKEAPQIPLALSGIPLPLPSEPELAPTMATAILRAAAYPGRPAARLEPIRVPVTAGAGEIEVRLSSAVLDADRASLNSSLLPTRASHLSGASVSLTSSTTRSSDRLRPASIPVRLLQSVDTRFNRAPQPGPSGVPARQSFRNGRQVTRRYILPAVPFRQAAHVVF